MSCHTGSGIRFGKKHHIISIIQAMFENSLSRACNIHTPFTCQEMINFSLAKASYTFFNKTQKRLHLKRDIYLSYGKQPILRNSKGHITGVVQRFFLANSQNIKNKIEKDPLLFDLGINPERYLHQASLEQNMGNRVSTDLIRYLSLGVFLKNARLGGYYG